MQMSFDNTATAIERLLTPALCCLLIFFILMLQGVSAADGCAKPQHQHHRSLKRSCTEASQNFRERATAARCPSPSEWLRMNISFAVSATTACTLWLDTSESMLLQHAAHHQVSGLKSSLSIISYALSTAIAYIFGRKLWEHPAHHQVSGCWRALLCCVLIAVCVITL
jgi:hypothetical protein